MNDEPVNTFSLDDDSVSAELPEGPQGGQRLANLKVLVALVKRSHASEVCYRRAEMATNCSELMAFFADTRELRAACKGEYSILAASLAGPSELDQELVSHLHDDQAKFVSLKGDLRDELLDECLICDELLLAEDRSALEADLLPQTLHLVERQLGRVTSTIELLQQFRDNDGLVRC